MQRVFSDRTLLGDTSLQGSRQEENLEISKLRRDCTVTNYYLYISIEFRAGSVHRPSILVIPQRVCPQ